MHENEELEFDEIGGLLLKAKELITEGREAIQSIKAARDPESPEGEKFSPEERLTVATEIKETGQALIDLGDELLEALAD